MPGHQNNITRICSKSCTPASMHVRQVHAETATNTVADQHSRAACWNSRAKQFGRVCSWFYAAFHSHVANTPRRVAAPASVARVALLDGLHYPSRNGLNPKESWRSLLVPAGGVAAAVLAGSMRQKPWAVTQKTLAAAGNLHQRRRRRPRRGRRAGRVVRCNW